MGVDSHKPQYVLMFVMLATVYVVATDADNNACNATNEVQMSNTTTQPLVISATSEHTGPSFMIQSNTYSNWARTEWEKKLQTADVNKFVSQIASDRFCEIHLPHCTTVEIGGFEILFKKALIMPDNEGFQELNDTGCLHRIAIVADNSTAEVGNRTMCRENQTVFLNCSRDSCVFRIYLESEKNSSIGIVFEIPIQVISGSNVTVSCGHLTEPTTTEAVTVHQSKATTDNITYESDQINIWTKSDPNAVENNTMTSDDALSNTTDSVTPTASNTTVLNISLEDGGTSSFPTVSLLYHTDSVSHSTAEDNGTTLVMGLAAAAVEEEDGGDKEDTNWDIVIGVLVAVGLVLILVFILIMFLCYRRRKHKEPTSPVSQKSLLYGPYEEAEPTPIPLDDGEYSTISVISGFGFDDSPKVSLKEDNECSHNDSGVSSNADSPTRDSGSINGTPRPPPKRPISGNLAQILRTKFGIGTKKTAPAAKTAVHDLNNGKVEMEDMNGNATSSKQVNPVNTIVDNDGLIINEIYESQTNQSNEISNADISGQQRLSDTVTDSQLYEDMDVNTCGAYAETGNKAADNNGITLSEAQPIIINTKDLEHKQDENNKSESPNGTESRVVSHTYEDPDDSCLYADDTNALVNADTTQPSDYFTDEYSDVVTSNQAAGNAPVTSENQVFENHDGEEIMSDWEYPVNRDRLTPKTDITQMIDNDIYDFVDV